MEGPVSVDATLLLAHYRAIRNSHKVVISHTGGTATGTVTAITAAGITIGGTTIPFANITGVQATP